MDTNEVSAERDAFVSEQSSLEHQLTGRTTELTASSSGYFSEVVDGYESILTPSSLDEMTVEQLTRPLRSSRLLRTAIRSARSLRDSTGIWQLRFRPSRPSV